MKAEPLKLSHVALGCFVVLVTAFSIMEREWYSAGLGLIGVGLWGMLMLSPRPSPCVFCDATVDVLPVRVLRRRRRRWPLLYYRDYEWVCRQHLRAMFVRRQHEAYEMVRQLTAVEPAPSESSRRRRIRLTGKR